MINIITFWHYHTRELGLTDWLSAFKVVSKNTAVILMAWECNPGGKEQSEKLFLSWDKK